MCMCVHVQIFKSFLTNQHNLYESKLQMYIFLGKKIYLLGMVAKPFIASVVES